jgi:hypothetical protein
VTRAGAQNFYSYDARGNMISGGGRTVTYDGLDRPVSITRGGVVTTFYYGPDGARSGKASNGQVTLYLGADEEITPEGRKIRASRLAREPCGRMQACVRWTAPSTGCRAITLHQSG